MANAIKHIMGYVDHTILLMSHIFFDLESLSSGLMSLVFFEHMDEIVLSFCKYILNICIYFAL